MVIKMFRMTLKQIQEIIDDQIELYPEGKDRSKLLEISNTLFDYRNPESEEEIIGWLEGMEEDNPVKSKKKKKMKKHRAIELYHKDSPFKPKVVKSKKKYTRKTKHKDKK